MTALHTDHYQLCLEPGERDIVLGLVDAARKDLHAELRRTDGHEYRDQLHQRQSILAELRNKLALQPAEPITSDELVDIESDQSFPASDPPSWNR